MAVTLERFIEYVSEIGFMTVEEVHDFLDELPLNKQPRSARRLVQEMLKRKKITKFQADLIFKGKLKRLVVGNYIVLEKIGQGGMGRVYQARHRRMDRIVALKLLPFSARQSPEAVSRFDREIRAAARLCQRRHRYIIGADKWPPHSCKPSSMSPPIRSELLSRPRLTERLNGDSIKSSTTRGGLL